MTTEVFRNMLYDSEETGDLEDVFAVIFDEFHYMNDRDRGTVRRLERQHDRCPSFFPRSGDQRVLGRWKEYVQLTVVAMNK